MGVRVPPFALALLSAQAVLAALLVGIRASSVVTGGQWSETTGTEGNSVAIIRRVMAGGPLYPDLNRDSTTSIYNFGFYRVYAAVAAIAPSLHQLLVLRGLSLAAGLVGVAALALIAERRLRAAHIPSPLPIAVVIACPAVIGPFAGWFVVSVRPDIAAFACEFVGLALVDRARGRAAWIVAASVAFAAAIACKQNTLGILLGTTCWLLYGRETRSALLLWLGVAAVAVISLATSGPFYLQHVFVALASAYMNWGVLVDDLTNAAVVGGAAFAAAALCGEWKRERTADAALPLTWPMLTSFLITLPQLARYGASRNYLIGSFALATVITGVAALTSARPWRRVAIVAVLLQTIVGASYFVPGHRGALLLNPPAPLLVDAVAKARVIDAGRTYTNDSTLALVWPAANGELESTDLSVFPYYAERSRVVETPEDRIRTCSYKTLLLNGGSLAEVAQRSGYSMAAPMDGIRVWLTRPAVCRGAVLR